MNNYYYSQTGIKFITDFQGSRLTFLLTSLVASDTFDFTSQNRYSTSQNFQAWFLGFFPKPAETKDSDKSDKIGFSSQIHGKSVFHKAKTCVFMEALCCLHWVSGIQHNRILNVYMKAFLKAFTYATSHPRCSCNLTQSLINVTTYRHNARFPRRANN